MTTSPSRTLLADGQPAPAVAENLKGESPFLIVCDHAGRALPESLQHLGLPPAAFEEHIAWDFGALALARRLAQALDAALIHQSYSRLVIDCNRYPDHPQSIVTASDRWRVTGNENLTDAERTLRRAAIFDPYHTRIAAEVDARLARGQATLLLPVHSFTPSMNGFDRPWHVGVLHLGNSRASTVMLDLLRAEPGLVVGDNEPYAMDGTDFTAPFHAHRRGLDAVELEIRQDLLQDPVQAQAMADLFIRLLPRLLAAL